VRTNSITAVGGAAALNVVESILLTLDESDIRQRQNEVYRLKNVPAQTVATAVSQFLQTQRQVLTADPGIISPFEQIEREVVVVPEAVSNSLLISATPRYFSDIKKVILQLDQSPRQVLIQALFIEVNLDNIDEYGMEFGAQDSILFKRSALTTAPQFITTTTNTAGVGTVASQAIISESATPGYLFNGQQLGNNTTPSVNASNVGTQLGTGFATALANSTLGYPGLLLQAGSQNLNLLLRALSYRNRVDILSRPMIRTVDNQTANIQVGAYVPIINGFNANATTGVNSPIVQQRQVGIILQVTPRITPDGLVVMEVIARKDQLAPTGVPLVTSPTGTVTSPIINTQNALTTIAVPNGQTVVLGGMITKNDTVQERKVPMLGDIPLLGQAFRYDFKETQRTELIIFLTPRIIHNDEEAEMFKEIEIGRLNFIESEAERMHGPLHGVFASPNVRTDPHYGPPVTPPETPETPEPTAPPPPRSGILPPPPPEPGLPGSSAEIPQIPQPLPLLEDDAGNGTTRRRNDDEEDLDAAFIQANYRVPQKGSDAAKKPSFKKSAAKSSAAPKSGSKASNSSKKTRAKTKTDDDQSQRMQRFAPDDQ
jgi:type II secretion system protein D